MEPLSALGLASAVIQIVDFSFKVVSRAREISKSVDGTSEDASCLEDATTNLNELMQDVQLQLKASGSYGQKTADKQLIKLAEESEAIATELQGILARIKRSKKGKERAVLSQGLISALGQKKIKSLADKLDRIRQEINSALLVSLQ
jgi:hypothetical protein